MNPSGSRNLITSTDSTKMKEHHQTVMLADNFPAKAYLLVTHLTETDPKISSFSSDGNSFEIYDQSIFAQKYLPQYFKHSNYGSFVRQLNLYGFTSSRLKENSDIVVWTHDSFRKDRNDLVKEIKRAKKTKSTKPSHVHIKIDPRSPSPPSLSDDVSSSDNTTAPARISGKGSLSLPENNTHPAIVRKNSIDQAWLESEFAFLKQQNKFLEQKLDTQNKFLEQTLDKQNRFLEQKLDTLLKITLRISPVSVEEIQVGEKRRRMSPVESWDPVQSGLESIYEEQKQFDGDDYGIEPSPYEGDRKMPHVAPDSRNNEFGVRDDSLKRFVDIMLNDDEEQEECKTMDRHEIGNNSSATSPAVAPAISPEINSTTSMPTETLNILDDELMEEAIYAMRPGATIDTDGDLFDDTEESALQMRRDNYPNELVTMTNAAVDKTGGPEPIRAISSGEIPTGQSGDIEEGHLPVGVHIIAAHAELVEENSNDASQQQMIERDNHHEHRYRKRVLCLLAFIGVVLVIGVTWPAVVITNDKKEKQNAEAHTPCSLKHGGKCKGSSSSRDWKLSHTDDDDDNNNDDPLIKTDDKFENSTEEFIDDNDESDTLAEESIGEDGQSDTLENIENTAEVLRSFSSVWHHDPRRKKNSSLFDVVHDGTLSSFSVTLEGANFVCSSQENSSD
mmetsp:Transcript_6675/g.15162  ORF Transcript_6675/g.15162 Transcript_6675/m.15162 type:complete len:674 (+) Transcript_6675:122-2143(+)